MMAANRYPITDLRDSQVRVKLGHRMSIESEPMKIKINHPSLS
jgi:hypothetical protein